MSKRDMKLSTEEDVEYHDHILSHASGTSKLELKNRLKQRLGREGLSFSTWSHYSLDLVRCHRLPSRAQGRRSPQSAESEEEMIAAGLMATHSSGLLILYVI